MAKTRSEDDTFDDKGWRIEVQQEADMEAGGFQIRLELGKMNGRQSGYSFKLEDDLPPGHQVETRGISGARRTVRRTPNPSRKHERTKTRKGQKAIRLIKRVDH